VRRRQGLFMTHSTSSQSCAKSRPPLSSKMVVLALTVTDSAPYPTRASRRPTLGAIHQGQSFTVAWIKLNSRPSCPLRATPRSSLCLRRSVSRSLPRQISQPQLPTRTATRWPSGQLCDILDSIRSLGRNASLTLPSSLTCTRRL